MKRIYLLAAAALLAGTGATFAASTPRYVTKAISNVNRPADDTKADADRKPAKMAVFAGVKPGQSVVDLVPGRGYFTRIFANIVGKKGQVYAFWPLELDAQLTKFKVPIPTDGAIDTNWPNILVVHKSLAEFPLPKKVDMVWTSQNYHDFHDSFMGPMDIAKTNKAIFDALKPGGVFIVLDHSAQAGSGIRDTDTLHRIDAEVVKTEVTAAGFVFEGETTVLANPADDRTKAVFDPAVRGKTDQFVYKFRKPR